MATKIKPYSCMVLMKGKSCLAFTFIAILLFASFFRPLFLTSLGNLSYIRLFKYVAYITAIVFGGLYLWRRLVSDIEESYDDELHNKCGALPVTNEDLPIVKDVKFIQLERFKLPGFFSIWKLIVAAFLSIVVFGYLKMHSHKANTFFSLLDNFSFTIIGTGAFLIFTLLVFDCLLFVMFCCKILFMFLQRDANISNNCESDQLLLTDIQNILNAPRKVLFHWKEASNRLISPSLKAVLTWLATTIVTFYSLYCAHRVLRVNHIDIPIRQLPSSLEHFNIVQVCDFHIGPWLWKEHVERVVDKINDLQPDIVVIVGDLVDLTTDKVLDAIQPLQKLKSKMGCFFVGGNHDYYLGDIDNIYKYLEKNDIQVLANENVKICHDHESDSCFYLVGTEDISQDMVTKATSGHNFDLTQAIVGVDSSMPVVLLTHQPSAAKKAALTDQRFDLILSGHTHGGQFFPVSLVVYLSTPFFQGLYHIKEGTYLYVSNGVGFWGIPMRLMAPPEIAVLSLVPDRRSTHVARVNSA